MNAERGSFFSRLIRIEILLAIALMMFVGSTALLHAQPGEAGKPRATEALLKRGEALFKKHCSSCHGDRGAGDGPAAYLLNPKPRDISLGSFRLISTDNVVPTDEDLFRVISRGMPGSAMPPWGHLSAKDRWALVYQIKKLAREGEAERLLRSAKAEGRRMTSKEALEAAAPEPGETIALPPEVEPTLESLMRGRQLYVAQCEKCHDLDGRGRQRQDLEDDEGNPIFPRDFTAGIFKGGTTSEDLAYRLLAGMPGTPMPAYELAPDELWPLIHYVQSLIKPGAQQRVEQHRTSLVAKRVKDPLGPDPLNPVWKKAKPTYIALMPLWWRHDRVEGVIVRALYNRSQLAIHLTWEDLTHDENTLKQRDFSDAAAIQFSGSDDPPFFAMGSKKHAVNIWYWNASRQRDMAAKYQDVHNAFPNAVSDVYQSLQKPPYGRYSPISEFATAKHDPTFLTGWGSGNSMSTPQRTTSVENLGARGFGTLTSQPHATQVVTGGARWEKGFYEVVLVRPIASSANGNVVLKPGKTVSVAFAIWDGHAGDRNGQKSVTIWHRLTLEK